MTCKCGYEWMWCAISVECSHLIRCCQRSYRDAEQRRTHDRLCCTNPGCYATFETWERANEHRAACRPNVATVTEDFVGEGYDWELQLRVGDEVSLVVLVR